jgi:hypothetical protein
MRIVDIQHAAPGLRGYRYRQSRGVSLVNYIQLRYVTSAGREVVLASVRVHHVELQRVPASFVELTGPGATALHENCNGAPFSSTSSPQALPKNYRLAEADRPEPEVPPPRAAALPSVDLRHAGGCRSMT